MVPIILLESRSKAGHAEPYANIRFLYGGVGNYLRRMRYWTCYVNLNDKMNYTAK